MINIKLSEKILPNFYDLWKACNDKTILNIVAKGGRNSSKSTTVSIRIIFNRMKHKSHALIIRKIDKTLRRSCREQLIWAINHLGVAEYWEWSKAATGNMTLIYKPTGASIFFEGANNPEKIKSYKTSDMPVTDVWFEELAEFKHEDEVTVITNSILRAELPDGLFYKFFFTYNPPKRKQNWCNKKYNTKFIPKNTFVHHSTYLTNIFVSNAFKEEARHIEETNIRRYKWEYLGEPIGGGVVPFENLVFRKITDEEIKAFDNIRQGIDWGYAADPFAFARIYYDKTRRKIFFIDEIYDVKLSNREAVNRIKNKNYTDITIIADSSEPKSIAEFNVLGVNCIGAKKGAGSVEYGEKWLDDLEEIVIDYDRTPNTAKEFENIDYQVDKDGNIKNKLEDKDNHIIDLTRYALENDMDNRESIMFC
jgi:phage terminase large subunit